MPHQSQFAGELSCFHCDASITANAWPLNGDAIPFYVEDARGTYSVEIKCQDCGKKSFVVWDENPGPVEQLDGIEDEIEPTGVVEFNPQLYLAVKVTVEQAIAQGVVDFNELVRLAETGLSENCDMNKIRPLLRKAWLEQHRGN